VARKGRIEFPSAVYHFPGLGAGLDGALLLANTYDGLGRCMKRAGYDWGGSVLLVTYDGWKPIVEWNGAGNWQAWNVYGPGPDEILWRYEPANTKGHLRYHHDVHGNVTALLTYAGEVLEKYTYDTFGRPTVTDANGTNPRTGSNWRNRFMFTAREYYPHLWLYDYRNRWYDPQLGRFLQTDPTGFDAGDMNLFRYCADDPVDRSDPTGLVDTSAASEIWQRQAAFDTASSSHSGLEQLEKQWQDRVAAARRQDMASHSEASIASTKYHNTRFGSVNHCNEFVGDMAEAAGRVRPMVWVEGFPGGFWRPAVSHELADRNVKIPGWTFPKPLSEARRNDIIAQQHGKGGHTGVVVGPGRSISVNSLEGGVVRAGEWGFRPYPGNGERKGDPPPVVRHYIAGSSAEW
jgi:RHS repeat-associated protein